MDDVGVDRTPLLRETIDVARWLIELSGPTEHQYKTVVIDTLDWLEKLINAATCKEGGKKTIEDFGYGKGYVQAGRRWEQLLHMLDACRARGMNVVLLAHARIERFSPPDGDQYDRWVPDLHKTVAPMIEEWCDEVLFARYRVVTARRDDGFGKRTRPVGGGERVVFTCEMPTHQAKRRIEMPDEIGLLWKEYEDCWPNGVADGNISGLVTDGSSKKKAVK